MSSDSLAPVYLQSYLEPLAGILSRDDVTDIYINRPGEVWIESLGGGIERQEFPKLSAQVLDRLARQIAAISHQGISREHPLLSASLPGGARTQIVMAPATRGALAMAIRKHLLTEIRLEDYDADGGFSEGITGAETARVQDDRQLQQFFSEGRYGRLLAAAVRQRRNILVSGGTSTGKTTFLNALIFEIPARERLIFIEDTPELNLRHDNAVGLIAARSALGETIVDTDELLNASLRMRPDRIILGEIRGREAYTFLRSVNTGHPGSMTTIHADTPDRAIEQLALLVLQAGTQLNRSDIGDYVRSTIDLFIQLERTPAGKRQVSEIKLSDRIRRS